MFNIIEFIKEGLGSNKKKNEVILDINADDNGEPYVEVTYYLGEDVIGLTRQMKLNERITDIINKGIGFIVPLNPIKTIYYNSYRSELGITYAIDEENWFGSESQKCVLGYIVDPKSNLDYEEKILLLYETAMKNISENRLVTVKGIALNPIAYGIDSFGTIDEITEERKHLELIENMKKIDQALDTNLSSRNNKINIKSI